MRKFKASLCCYGGKDLQDIYDAIGNIKDIYEAV